MKLLRKHKLWPEDEDLLSSMVSKYQSSNERKFFEKVREKMEWDRSVSKDLLLSERDNEDGLYLERENEEEFIVGQYLNGNFNGEEHVMTLSEALNVNLKQKGWIDQDITFFEWLRKQDYKGMMYDHNFDYL